MVLKIDYDKVKLQKVTYDVFLWHHKDYASENTSSKWRHQSFPFSSPSLSKILVAFLTVCNSLQSTLGSVGSIHSFALVTW